MTNPSDSGPVEIEHGISDLYVSINSLSFENDLSFQATFCCIITFFVQYDTVQMSMHVQKRFFSLGNRHKEKKEDFSNIGSFVFVDVTFSPYLLTFKPFLPNRVFQMIWPHES